MSLTTRKIAVAIFTAAVLLWLIAEIAFFGGFDDAGSILREIALIAVAFVLVVTTWRPISRR